MCLQVFIHAFRHFQWPGGRGQWPCLFRGPHQVQGHFPWPWNFIYNPRNLLYLSERSWFQFSIWESGLLGTVATFIYKLIRGFRAGITCSRLFFHAFYWRYTTKWQTRLFQLTSRRVSEETASASNSHSKKVDPSSSTILHEELVHQTFCLRIYCIIQQYEVILVQQTK